MGVTFGLLEQFWKLARNALPLFGLNYKVGLADMPDCPRCGRGLEKTAEHAFYYCERVRPFLDRRVDGPHRTHAARATRRWLQGQHFTSVSRWEACGVSRDPSCSKNGEWDNAKKKGGLYDDVNFSHRDLILFFGHQLRVKIRCDRKRLDSTTFDWRWVHAASLVVRKGATLESSFPPLLVHGDYGAGPSGPHPG